MPSETYSIKIDDETSLSLPLVRPSEDFGIYSFVLIGERRLNERCALALQKQITSTNISYDLLLTAEAKALGMVEQLASMLGCERYIVARKSQKVYMKDAVSISVQSITDAKEQTLCLDGKDADLLRGKRVCFVDDVVSQGGTLNAIFRLAEVIGFEVVVIACVLTEGVVRKEFRGVPLVALDHIPLPFA
ncbi:MAG: hypothetical protein LBG97_06750 [Coriobacteriales bacterium]|jgi:adenine phosphoribosyltransferase|nr:hypothetical protein [Coriobacteriales bacterium]